MFNQLPDHPSNAPIWGVALAVILVTLLTFYAIFSFEPPTVSRPWTAHLFSGDATCEQWAPILPHPNDPRFMVSYDFKPCIAGEPPKDFAHSGCGDLTLVLDSSLRVRASTREYRIGTCRYFLTRIHPLTYNSLTWRHEEAHIVQGHTGLKPVWGLNTVLNILLDTMFADPYALWGRNSRLWFGAMVATAIMLALYWAWARRT
jgi:protein-S-isoprenylcysteine O-methyltransferase Ste14